mmetsp:Transcript_3684/g.5596  ORF Transcript_3684/g.5596 Transcript_3684/m.5596 type:complete len:312 (+) Transcript_3684:60-995(+)
MIPSLLSQITQGSRDNLKTPARVNHLLDRIGERENDSPFLTESPFNGNPSFASISQSPILPNPADDDIAGNQSSMRNLESFGFKSITIANTSHFIPKPAATTSFQKRCAEVKQKILDLQNKLELILEKPSILEKASTIIPASISQATPGNLQRPSSTLSFDINRLTPLNKPLKALSRATNESGHIRVTDVVSIHTEKLKDDTSNGEIRRLKKALSQKGDVSSSLLMQTPAKQFGRSTSRDVINSDIFDQAYDSIDSKALRLHLAPAPPPSMSHSVDSEFESRERHLTGSMDLQNLVRRLAETDGVSKTRGF